LKYYNLINIKSVFYNIVFFQHYLLALPYWGGHVKLKLLIKTGIYYAKYKT